MSQEQAKLSVEAGTPDYSMGEIAKVSAGDDIDEDETALKELLATMMRDVRDQIVEHEQQIIATVRALGGSTSRYRRERRNQVRAIVSEICAPVEPRLWPNFCPSSR